jgi:tetratricopeptide (TPR) repeat protein
MNVASAGYYLLGDLHFVHDAPLAAVNDYRHSHRLFPYRAAALRDIGDCLFWMGRDDDARRFYSRALSINPGDDMANTGLDMLERRERFRDAPPYRAGDVCWAALECLANSDPLDALTQVAGRRSMVSKRIRAMALGQLGDTDAALHEWQRLARSGSMIVLDSKDWFYLSDALWELPQFWETMLSMAMRVSSLGLDSPTGHLQGPPILKGPCSAAARRKLNRLALEFHVARSTTNTNKLAQLAQRYPQWVDPRSVVSHVQLTGKAPTRGEFCQAVMCLYNKCPM